MLTKTQTHFLFANRNYLFVLFLQKAIVPQHELFKDEEKPFVTYLLRINGLLKLWLHKGWNAIMVDIIANSIFRPIEDNARPGIIILMDDVRKIESEKICRNWYRLDIPAKTNKNQLEKKKSTHRIRWNYNFVV